MMRLSWKWRLVPIAVLGIVYLSLTAFKKDPEQNKNLNESVVVVQQTARVPASEEAVKPTAGQALNNEKSAIATASTEPTVSQISVPKPEILKNFKALQVKVFRNKEDEKKWKKLISDSKYISELSAYLKDLPKLDPQEFKNNQNAVIDLLVEALRGGDSAAAEQAILDVIKDAQVEDEKLAQSSRELLAGVKAELLYQSSSIKPKLAGQFESLLPGPVSQKIWKNVQQQQADNLALSEAELQERIARRNQ
jgi:hypothetical protein